jgi:hypothetical protein
VLRAWNERRNAENTAVGSLKRKDKRKAVALWIKQSEGVDGRG